MFKYISEILSKLSVGQRLLALVFLLLSITFISVGPKIVGAFTQDNEELKSKIDLQRTEIQSLTQRVMQLNDQVIEGQMSCTNRFAQREQEILTMISALETEAQKTNGKVTVLEEKQNPFEKKYQTEEYGDGDNGMGGSRPKVAMMPAPEPVVQTKTIVKTDNTNLLKMIKGMKKDLQSNKQ
jgi:hypothetical protein